MCTFKWTYIQMIRAYLHHRIIPYDLVYLRQIILGDFQLSKKHKNKSWLYKYHSTSWTGTLIVWVTRTTSCVTVQEWQSIILQTSQTITYSFDKRTFNLKIDHEVKSKSLTSINVTPEGSLSQVHDQVTRELYRSRWVQIKNISAITNHLKLVPQLTTKELRQKNWH